MLPERSSAAADVDPVKVAQSFTVARPLDDVWAFFQRIPDVAECMPGAAMTGEKAAGVYTGKVALKLGPFGASFDGEATVAFDQTAHSGHVEGKGVDKRGGSRSRMTVDFALMAPSPDKTTVSVDADVTLSGAIAQFGRTGIIQETANILIGDFVTELERRLAPVVVAAPTLPSQPKQPSQLKASRIILLTLGAWLRRLLGHGRAKQALDPRSK